MESQDFTEWRNRMVTAVMNGDDAALRVFYAEHFKAVYRYVLCRVDGDHHAAEEITSEVFYRAFRDMEGYDGRHAPGAWLCGIARHRVLDYYRVNHKKPVLELLFSQFDEAFTKRLFDLESQELPDSEIEREETAKVVALVLSALPQEYERVLRMRYLDERPVNEMAAALNTTPKAAEDRLYRARIAFRDAFKLAGQNLQFE
jgi:RNA polymerase sigma-70 factor, ECF subfamily